MYARDGYDYDGYRLRVEFPKGGGGSFRGGRGAGGGRGGDKLIHQDLLLKPIFCFVPRSPCSEEPVPGDGDGAAAHR